MTSQLQGLVSTIIQLPCEYGSNRDLCRQWFASKAATGLPMADVASGCMGQPNNPFHLLMNGVFSSTEIPDSPFLLVANLTMEFLLTEFLSLTFSNVNYRWNAVLRSGKKYYIVVSHHHGLHTHCFVSFYPMSSVPWHTNETCRSCVVT